jgi:hypothetical protein
LCKVDDEKRTNMLFEDWDDDKTSHIPRQTLDVSCSFQKLMRGIITPKFFFFFFFFPFGSSPHQILPGTQLTIPKPVEAEPPIFQLLKEEYRPPTALRQMVPPFLVFFFFLHRLKKEKRMLASSLDPCSLWFFFFLLFH